jgi:formylglycine-generating enzyme required for sulfatase activity
MPEKNYYKILQIDPSAEPEIVQAAYKRLALKYHPDTNPSLDATRRMQEINEAYEVLRDPTRRADFDRQFADRMRQPNPAAEYQRQQEPAPRSTRQQPQSDLRLTLAPGVTMDFVHVPAGDFVIGSTDQQATGDEKPPHKVYLDEYLIGKYPVTVAQFAAFIRRERYRTAAENVGSAIVQKDDKYIGSFIEGANWQHPFGPSSNVSQKESHPVTQVSWNDAMAFCEWMTKQTGMKVRLPTEAEWEKAARGLDSRMYSWGNVKPTNYLCNFNENVNDTTPVGQYSPQSDSPYGCADMLGNVWEWCADWFDENYYAQSPRRNPTGPATGRFRVQRGGSWHYLAIYVRASRRHMSFPDQRYDDAGFRCAANWTV